MLSATAKYIKTHFRRRKDDDTPSINFPMVGKNIRHRRRYAKKNLYGKSSKNML